MDKQSFLTNIAQRLDRVIGQPPDNRMSIGVPDFFAQRTMSNNEQLDRFETQFTAQGGALVRAQDIHSLQHSLNEYLVDLGATSVGSWGRTAAWTVDVESVLDQWNAVRFDETTPSEFAKVQVSITGCAYAIADTGTIVMMSGKGQGRSAHVLPLMHIVVIHASQIRLRLGEVLQELSACEQPLPSSIHFVSGPSRSSDIENDQSIGVHGPARVVAFVLDN